MFLIGFTPLFLSLCLLTDKHRCEYIIKNHIMQAKWHLSIGNTARLYKISVIYTSFVTCRLQ